MARKKKKIELYPLPTETPSAYVPQQTHYNFEFLNQFQKDAWDVIEKNEITFLLGAAGTGKSQIATAFAAKALLTKRCRKIVLTRPMVATEQMGFIPGNTDEKLLPYLIPILDCLDECVGKQGQDRKRVDESLEFAPIAFLRGRTWSHTCCIVDEAQNMSYTQLKLVLTRLGKRSKIIVTGDPEQSDLRESGLMHAVGKLHNIEGVGIVNLTEQAQVRNPLITKILERL
jgi:phosphate starvation-inducible PhoH-like protein